MNQLLEKSEQRDLQILSLLYSEERWWSIEELALKSNCSVGSANRSIQYLTEFSGQLEDVFEIILKQKQGVFLQMTENNSISQLQEKYLRETFSYKIVDHIFYENDLTIEKLMDKFYLSRSTIYRKLKSIEYMFKQNKLTFEKSSLKLGGSEINIREFFFVFYWSIAKNGDWPFQSVNQELLDFRLKNIIQETNLKLSSIEYMQLMYRLAINFVQHSKKQYIIELPQNVQLDPYRLVFFKSFGEKMVEFLPKEYQVKEFNYLGLIFSTYPYIESQSNDEYLEKIISWQQATNTLTYQYIQMFLKGMETIYPEKKLSDLIRQPKVMFMMIAITNYGLLFPDVYIQNDLPNSWRIQLEKIEKQVPMFYENVKKLIDDLRELPLYNEKLIDSSYTLYAFLALFSQNFDVSLFETVIKVKLICAADPVSEFSLSKQLKNMIGYNTIIHNSDYKEDTDITYDLVVSDLKLQGTNDLQAEHVYSWSFPPSQRDWLNLKKIMDQIITEKSLDEKL